MYPIHLLIKLPSRQRPRLLLDVASQYSALCADPLHTSLLVSLDEDDRTVSVDVERTLIHESRLHIHIVRGPRSNKIGAINRDMQHAGAWDILLVASDDQVPVMEGYDAVIRRDMASWFTQGDGCLWYSDGRQDRICTQCVMDRRYYDRHGYIYHPAYHSYCCDDEYTEVAMAAGRMVKLPDVLCRHDHCCWTNNMPDDALYQHNRAHKQQDQATLHARRAAGYP